MFRSLLIAAFACGPGLASGPDPATLVVGKEDLARAKSLIGLLGDPLFAVREKAQRELAGMGRKALQPLADSAMENPDPEVRLRCRKLIPAARADDFQARVETFLADTEGKYKHRLPGLDIFFDATGKNETARKVYIDILNNEENRRFLSEAEGDTAVLATVVQNRSQQLYYRQYPRAVAGQPVTPSTPPDFKDVLTILLVDTRVPPEKQVRRTGIGSPSYLLNNTNFRPTVQGNTPEAELCRKVVAKWLDTRVESYDLYYGMTFLTNANQKEESIRAAKRLLASKTAIAFHRGYAMSTLARFADKEAVPDLLPVLTDETLCTTRFVNANERYPILMKDVALAALVAVTGQKHTDYEFDPQGGGTGVVLNYSSYWFKSDEDRAKGFEKWKAWVKANPKAVEVRSEKK